jgi:hypothetical protein
MHSQKNPSGIFRAPKILDFRGNPLEVFMKTIKNKIVYEKDINDTLSKAIAIVFPDSIQELKNLVKVSHNDLVLRGSGSSFTSGVVPRNSTVIDFSKMNKILDINPIKKSVLVEPGLLLSELNEALEQYGLEFPIIPLFPGIETIGGMIAKNSSGAREIKYGRMNTWVDSLEVINGKGEQMRISKSDVSDFVGMEGITGIIIQATLRLTAKKNRSLTILKSDNLDFILQSNRKLRLDQDICSVDILNKETSKLLGFEQKYHLFVEYESEKGMFKNQDYEKYLKLKSKAYSKLASEGFYLMESIKIFSDSLVDFITYLEENKIPYFGHLASGVLYPCFRREDSLKQENLLVLSKKLKANISYNFGFGLKNKYFLPLQEKDLIRRVKARHDPDWKFNRDKLIDYKLKEEKQTEKLEKELKKEEKIQGKIAEEQKDQIPPKLAQSELITLNKPEEKMTIEEKEKIKKLAFGFFAGNRGEES